MSRQDLKSWAIVVGGVVAVVAFVWLAILGAIAENERCQQAGGKRICHTTNTTWTDHKGRTQYGSSTDCRCLAQDGHEVVP